MQDPAWLSAAQYLDIAFVTVPQMYGAAEFSVAMKYISDAGSNSINVELRAKLGLHNGSSFRWPDDADTVPRSMAIPLISTRVFMDTGDGSGTRYLSIFMPPRLKLLLVEPDLVRVHLHGEESYVTSPQWLYRPSLITP